ncbi:hypothetical protein RFI_34336 [Reticulomyxa filosa]|uniref:Uncharacterized protein n=1 Tax=Reticulomyxa filosa TaxID=46433 RepID=X6LN82_RETFI|nr:hypothetical protein RFI_34336 [Reticulomyxa filosa]|eukprot:ETO03074.1 hypothetical protein RFI_34336 [Reticulomyxa filosa]
MDISASKITTPFETLNPLPVPLCHAQCISYNEELLICGGTNSDCCYSYHIPSNQYKLICLYPNATLQGHCVVQLKNSPKHKNGITLLSFGGFHKHTLMMNYVSVWSNDSEREKIKDTCNIWLPFIDSENKAICIGKSSDNYEGARAVVDGNLLFITYYPNNISVFNLHTLQYVNQSTLPIQSENGTSYHCFVLKTCYGLESMARKHEMVLFCEETGLSIEYDEESNSFGIKPLHVCRDMRFLLRYAYVCINETILFFGGYRRCTRIRDVFKYAMHDNIWTKFERTLPIPLHGCAAIPNGDKTFVHILGGKNTRKRLMSTHTRTGVQEWLGEETPREKQWMAEEQEISQLRETKHEIEAMEHGFEVKKLKVELRQKEIKTVIEYWLRSLLLNFGWTDYFDIIIARYILTKYFKPLKEMHTQYANVSTVKFSSDGSKLVLSSGDGTVWICDIDSGKEIQVRKEYSRKVNGTIFSPDCLFFVSYSNDNTIQIFDAKSNKEIKKFQGHSETIRDVNFSPDGQTVVSCSDDKTIRLWDVKTETEIQILKGHSSCVTGVEFSLDGNMIVSQSIDGNIQLWERF